MLAAALAGVGLQAFSQYQQGVAAKSENEAAAAIANQNAKIAENQAIAEKEAARYKAEVAEERGQKLIASQIAGYGKAGVTLSGSPLTVVEKTYGDILKDVSMILREGSIAAGQRKSEADIYRAQSSQFKQMGKYAYRGGILSSVGTGLSGVGNYMYTNTMMKYYKSLTPKV